MCPELFMIMKSRLSLGQDWTAMRRSDETGDQRLVGEPRIAEADGRR